MPRAIVPLADGVEEMEAVTVVDVLRRAEVEVRTVSIGAEVLTASRGVRLVADALWEPGIADDVDLLAIPGGLGGTHALREDTRVLDAVRAVYARGGIVAAVCAGPLVLLEAGILEGRVFTSHPAVRDQFPTVGYTEDRIVVDGNLVTSRGPGTALEFALALVACVAPPDVAEDVRLGMLAR